MGEQGPDIESIFHGALDVGDAGERSAYLDHACGNDGASRRRIEALLRAHEQAGSFLEDSPVDPEKHEGATPADENYTRSISGPSPDDSSPDKIAQRHLPNIPGYRILGVLGQGGMGIVYRAVQTKLNRTVALKVLPAVVGAANPQIVERFRREAKAAARLHHTNIIPIYDFGESHDAHFFAMELVSGQSLDKVIRRFAEEDATTASPARLAHLVRVSESGAPASSADADSSTTAASSTASATGKGRAYYRQVASWMADAADALHFAHSEGIIHRDIKPGNLILADDGRIMIADFGLAKGTGEMSVTLTGSLMGTLRYMSPEQAMAKRMRIDHRTDIYSLGATLYELLTFRPAFEGRDDKEILGAIITREPTAPRKITPGVPRELETICQKMMEKAPGSRYDTARALAEDLRRYINDMPIVAQRPGVVTRSIKFARRRKAPVIAACATVLLAATAVLWARASDRAKQKAFETKQERVKTLITMAGSASQNQDWATAEERLSTALELDPANVKTLIWMALIRKDQFNETGNPSDQTLLVEAERFCRDALAIEPDNIAALNTLGVVLKKLGRLDAAGDAYQRVIELQPDYCAAWVNLGTNLALQGNLPEADRHLRKAVSLAAVDRPSTVDAWRNLASLLLFQGHFRAAAENIEMALRCKRDDAASLLVKARLQLSTEPDGAVKTAINADYLSNGQDGKTKRVLALAQLYAGRLEEAKEAAREAIALDDMPAINHLIIAAAAARSNDQAQADEHLQRARQVWPKELPDSGSVRTSAEKGVLWFDTADELQRLLDLTQGSVSSPGG